MLNCLQIVPWAPADSAQSQTILSAYQLQVPKTAKMTRRKDDGCPFLLCTHHTVPGPNATME